MFHLYFVAFRFAACGATFFLRAGFIRKDAQTP